MSKETDFSLYLSPGTLILHFLKILIFEKVLSLLKLTFKATQLEKVAEYHIFQKTLSYTLASSMNLGLSAFPV